MRNEQYRTYDRKRSYRQVVVLDEEGIDRILEQSPSDARYFVGVFVWPPAELEKEVSSGSAGLCPAISTVRQHH
jgi:hypothetical protein